MRFALLRSVLNLALAGGLVDIYAMINYSNDIFEINPTARISVGYIGAGQHCLVEVDNVLKYPDRAREFLEQIPQQDTIREGRNPPGYFPGYQTYIAYDFFPLNQFVNGLLETYFAHRLRGPSWSYQNCNSQRPVYMQSRYPHADAGQIAANIFLNTNDEIEGLSGTGFYQFRETGEEAPFPSVCGYKKQRYGYANPDQRLAPLKPVQDDENWVQYHISTQQWNKLNLYEGSLFHCVYFQPGMFKDISRRTLSMVDR